MPVPMRTHCSLNCGLSRDDSPLFRKGPDGPQTLCNACGLCYRKTGQMRDVSQLFPCGRNFKRRRMDEQRQQEFLKHTVGTSLSSPTDSCEESFSPAPFKNFFPMTCVQDPVLMDASLPTAPVYSGHVLGPKTPVLVSAPPFMTDANVQLELDGLLDSFKFDDGLESALLQDALEDLLSQLL